MIEVLMDWAVPEHTLAPQGVVYVRANRLQLLDHSLELVERTKKQKSGSTLDLDQHLNLYGGARGSLF